MRQGIGKWPQPGQRPQRQSAQARKKCARQYGTHPNRQTAQRRVGCGHPQAQPRKPWQGGGQQTLGPVPRHQCAQHSDQLHQRPRRRCAALGKGRIHHPMGDLNRQGGRQSGAKNGGHIHAGHRIGQNGINRQAQQRVKAGQHRQDKPPDPAIAQRRRHHHPARCIGLWQGCQCHQQQKRHFFGNQPQYQRPTSGIIQDQQIRRAVPSGGPRRQCAGNPTGWCDQKRQTQSSRCMRHRKQRRQHMLDHTKDAAAQQGRHDQQRNHQGQPG